ncbi:Biotin carboxyl carrier protein of acetyl-CoA carboxylase [Melia azedarach]|uniref:Biotin carboxyl carrier protein of acetyl-CoA carboxylase n=1 Tax=Melia azedarach TaxID=155640 RepID=A0ACC1X7N6_MELAZ|nr:Biotin carboxyl carrier protein of acetyl-CoA carboxylase [Melia azedarach]
MVSISVPCPKISLVARAGSTSGQQQHQKQMVSFPNSSNPNPSSLSLSSAFSGFQCSNNKQSPVWKVHAKVNEVTAEKPLNSAPAVDPKPQVASSEGKVESPETKIPDASAISAFMKQVSDLVKLVDSRDIVELQMKQSDCELTIRKKEALQQPAPVVNMPPAMPHMMYPTPSPAAPAAAPAPTPATPAASAPAPALPPPAKPASSHPPLKCPMAGTFYRCPAPGEPPFVKVGDKVQKGQIVCIIEAMKLMNEIEADQSGTVTEILVEDGKSVSVDMPLFVIVP